MQWPAGFRSSQILRVSAAVGLLLLGVTEPSPVIAQPPAAEARIDAPADGTQVDGVVEIRGRATAPAGRQFNFYRLLIGIGKTPSIMRPLGPPYDQPVENGVLARWDTDRFPSDEYLLTLQVYADDGTYESASAVVTVKYKPTPTPLAILLPTMVDVPTLVPAADSDVAAGPVDAPPALDVVIPPFNGGPPPAPALAPITPIAPPREVVPIQPIPLDPINPGPFSVATPMPWSPGQSPGDPAPVYVTPIDFNPQTY